MPPAALCYVHWAVVVAACGLLLMMLLYYRTTTPRCRRRRRMEFEPYVDVHWKPKCRGRRFGGSRMREDDTVVASVTPPTADNEPVPQSQEQEDDAVMQQ